MFTYPSLYLARTFFKMFLRDRQTIFFGLFFPLVFLTALGVMSGGDRAPIDIGIADHSGSPLAARLVGSLAGNPSFHVETGEEADLRQALLDGGVTMVLVIPAGFRDAESGTDLKVYVDASQVRLLGLVMPTLQNALLRIERELRHTTPLFRLDVEDVKARSRRYLDFLLPGVLAFTLMQISIAGSGFNIVEYRRKGILKRLFVTALRPAEFITAICLARLAWCLMQLTALLLVAVLLLGVVVVGSYVELYAVIVLGTAIFLCIGFCVGSVSRTQQGVGAVGNIVLFPQLFLSGVFFPIDVMPGFIQPVARALPLSFVVDCLRGISIDGASLASLWPQLIGVAVWMAISFTLATRLFSWKHAVR